MATIYKHSYTHMFGATTVGDRVRLADTDLWLAVEKYFTGNSSAEEQGAL